MSLERQCLPIIAQSPAYCIIPLGGEAGFEPGFASRLIAYLVSHTDWDEVLPQQIDKILPGCLFVNGVTTLNLDSINLNDPLLAYIAQHFAQRRESQDDVAPVISSLTVSAAYTALGSGLLELFEACGSHVHSLAVRNVELHHPNRNLGLDLVRSDCLSSIDLQLYCRKDELDEVAILVANHSGQISSFSLLLKGITLLPLDSLFKALADHSSGSLRRINVSNFSVEKDVLSAFLLACSKLICIKLDGSISLDLNVMTQLKPFAQWQQLDLGFQVTPPVETYECLKVFPPSVVDLGLTFGPTPNLVQQRQIVESFLQAPKLLALKYHTQLFHPSLISLFFPVYGPTLTSLDIAQCDSLTDDGLALILECCRVLEKLSIHSDVNRMNRKITGHPLMSYDGRRLRVLYLNYFKSLLPDVLMFVAEHYHDLEEVYLAGVTAVNDEFVASLVRNCKNLRKLDFQKCWNISDRAIEAIAEVLNDRLLDLNISNCFRLTDASLTALGRHCPNLQVLLRHGTIQMSKGAVADLRKRVLGNLKHFRFDWFS